MKDSVQTAVLGVSGYAGMELARILLHHPRLKKHTPLFLGREDADGAVSLTSLHPQLLRGDGSDSLKIQPFSWDLLKEHGVEVLFLATPHEQSREYVPAALAHGIRVIDLSGAWRLTSPENRAVYKFTDDGTPIAAEVQGKAVYGSPELYRQKIPAASLIANPGCYATSVILALKPLLASGLIDVDRGIVSDAKSGVSGAGKAPTAKTHFMYAADNLSAYAVFAHRHTGELLEQLSLEREQIVFTPHLLPIPRGILATTYVTFKEKTTPDAVAAIYQSFYAGSPMVRLFGHGSLPQIQYSVHTNYCDIGFQLDRDARRCVVVSCLDNLLKGASGQAVQNLNVMQGWGESEGLA